MEEPKPKSGSLLRKRARERSKRKLVREKQTAAQILARDARYKRKETEPRDPEKVVKFRKKLAWAKKILPPGPKPQPPGTAVRRENGEWDVSGTPYRY